MHREMAPSATTLKPSGTGTQATRGGVGIRWDASAIRSSAPPVRIVGSVRPYRGGFRLNV